MELTAENLSCERGGRTVFTDVSFTLAAGGFLQLMGPNGAGKSSLLRMIAGFVEPVSGKLTSRGLEPADAEIGQFAHLVGHQDAIKTPLSVRENLEFWGRYLGHGDIGTALGCFGLEPLADLPAQYLSAGQRRRLALSRLGLVTRPLWLLDEPTVGLDSESQSRLLDLLRRHLSLGGLAIAATHVPIDVAGGQSLVLTGAPAAR